uniref:Putative conserved protein with signal anchor n=1 Tax=Ixodes scapularis TaxID=6945 RepID=A0A4D5RFL9_IXOSC
MPWAWRCSSRTSASTASCWTPCLGTTHGWRRTSAGWPSWCARASRRALCVPWMLSALPGTTSKMPSASWPPANTWARWCSRCGRRSPSGRRYRPLPSRWRPTRAPASSRTRATLWPEAWAASALSWPTGWWPGAAASYCSRPARAFGRATSASACTAGGWPAPRWP